MLERYCVVIPTMGRGTLGRAIDSALAQTHAPESVIVIGDGVEGRVIREDLRELVRFHRCQGSGVSAARNRGVAAVHAPWVAFLDDDDEWSPTKMATQLEGRSAQAGQVLLTAASVRRGHRAERRPSASDCFTPDHDIFERLYGRSSMRRSRIYLPTSSVVAPHSVASQFPFDEELSVREDIWWFHLLQRAGVRLEQLNEVLITCHASVKRARRRESVDSLSRWAGRIGAVQARYARNFLLGMALREAILAGDPGKVAWTSSHGLRMLMGGG